MSNIKLFESKLIRSTFKDDEQKWYFSVQDVVEALTNSVDVKDYIKKMKKREKALSDNWGTICPLVEMVAADCKKRKILFYVRRSIHYCHCKNKTSQRI